MIPHIRVFILMGLISAILTACSSAHRGSIEGVWVAAGEMSDPSDAIEFKSDGSIGGSPAAEKIHGRWEQRGNAVILRRFDPRFQQFVESTCTVTNDDGILELQLKASPGSRHIWTWIRKESVSTETNLFGLWVGKGSDPFAISLTDTYSAVVSAGMMSWPAKWRRHAKDIMVEVLDKDEDEDAKDPLRFRVSLGDLPDSLDVFSAIEGTKLETLNRAGTRKLHP